MKVILCHADAPIKWSGVWIYVGTRYTRMKYCEARIGGQRVSLSKGIRDKFEENRGEFLKWVEAQRQANKDSLYWWMSHVAGRNNMVALLFIHFCQLCALNEQLKKKCLSVDKILIVCEDTFLLKFFKENLRLTYTVSKSILTWRGTFKDISRFIYRTGVNVVREVFHAVKHAWFARKTRTPQKNPAGRAVLVHQCLDDKAFKADGSIVDRYFAMFPSWIKKQGKQVYFLPWLYNVRKPLFEVYRFLRQNDTVVPADYLTCTDYVKSFFNHIRSVFVKMNPVLNRVHIGALVCRERFEQLVSMAQVRFWLYGPALKRWAQNFEHLTLLDVYEGMPPEHVQVHALKGHLKSVKFVGYNHSVASRDFLAFWSLPSEWVSIMNPDVVVTNGNIGKEVFLKQGVPAERVLAGPALRQQFLQEPDDIKKKGLLILLSLDNDLSSEILHKMVSQAPLLSSLNVPVTVKPHPMTGRESVLELAGLVSLPEGWRWADGEIYDEMKEVSCCVALGTAGVYDVVLAGCVLLPLRSELGVMENYLDILQDEFPVLRALEENEISGRIMEVFVTRKDEFKTAFNLIRTRVMTGFSPVNDANLNIFLQSLSI
ncbi:hypothetical protein K1X76_03475 [bacterium]|nr:hypothetical protein [bacterium]